jgi:hypothetical protein
LLVVEDEAIVPADIASTLRRSGYEGVGISATLGSAFPPSS